MKLYLHCILYTIHYTTQEGNLGLGVKVFFSKQEVMGSNPSRGNWWC